ncbi:hypothetical protein GCM10025858_27490 [Alicyclobacillus sacchari]|uniref:hypothetical protein n=1 Tax=Alicyclobacillus sacchari TaxID=392010 RepID=UPI0023EA30BE|nr:hypothetical protein [Alicyclobacillus sacchari]GMA58246.1 hypothetical protein GCM10025858_27490 [Alicyclobacillus sacchari]
MQDHIKQSGDFTTNGQIVRLSGAAVLVGAVCAVIAIALLKAIYLVTNIAFFHRLSFQYATPTANHLGAYMTLPPFWAPSSSVLSPALAPKNSGARHS